MAYTAGNILQAAAENGTWQALSVGTFTGGTVQYKVSQSGTLVEIRTTALLSGSIANNTLYTIIAAASLPAAIKPSAGYALGRFFTGWNGGQSEALLSSADGLQIRQSTGGTLTGNMAIHFLYTI